MRRLCVLVLMGVLVPAVAAAQETVRLEGRLIHAQGLATGRVGLSFGGFGTTLTRADGSFTHTFPADAGEAVVAVLDNGWAVLYPPGGHIPIPRTEGVTVDVVVGEPMERVLAAAVAEKHERLRTDLLELGAGQEQIRTVLDEFLAEVRTRMDLDEAELRRAVDLAAERTERYPQIASALKDYVLKAQDVKDAFRLLAELAVRNPGVVQSLDTTILAYNEAYETLNNERPGFEQAVAAYWQNERLTAELRSLMDYALGEIHRALILQLNDSLVGIHQLQGASAARREERGAALAREIDFIVAQLEPRLDELDRRTERMLQALFTE